MVRSKNTDSVLKMNYVYALYLFPYILRKVKDIVGYNDAYTFNFHTQLK